jgi:hypothetical protein
VLVLNDPAVRWHGLAEKVSTLITSKLLKELHAALVLPNAANMVIEPLATFDSLPEISVTDLVGQCRLAL